MILQLEEIEIVPEKVHFAWRVFGFYFLRFTCFFLTVVGLRCCMRAFSSGEQGLLFIVVRQLLIASLAAEHRLETWASVVAAHGLWSMHSVAVAQRFSCSMACGIFLD